MKETKRQLLARVLGDARTETSPALTLAALATAYGRAKAEGRTDDAAAIRREAFELQAAQLGVTYDVFCEGVAEARAARPTMQETITATAATLDQLDASLDAWVGATRAADLRPAVDDADAAVQGEAARQPSAVEQLVAQRERLLVQSTDLYSRLWHLRGAAPRGWQFVRLDRMCQRALRRDQRRRDNLSIAELALLDAPASPRRCLSCADVLPLGSDGLCNACTEAGEDAGSAVLAA